MSIVEITKTCQTCLMPHKFLKNNTRGTCIYLSERAGQTVKITRSTLCRFYQVDSRAKASVKKAIAD